MDKRESGTKKAAIRDLSVRESSGIKGGWFFIAGATTQALDGIGKALSTMAQKQ
jgi:hypothetical protein